MNEACWRWLIAMPMLTALGVGFVCAGFAIETFLAIELPASLAWTIGMALSFGLAVWLAPQDLRTRHLVEKEFYGSK